jgi:hypothetical protein
MKKLVFFIFFLNTFFCFSQENEKRSYSFNTFTSSIITYYGSKIYRNNYVFVKNEKDENYYLSINNDLMTATLNDFTLNKIFHFKLKKRVEKIVDLKQLDTAFYNPKSKLHCNCNSSEKSEKPIVEEIEYERDTINKKFIVHRMTYKNNKKKKIIHEDYFIFKENTNTANIDKTVSSKFFSDKFNIPFTDNDDLEKIIEIKDGKKMEEYEYVFTKKENITLNFIVKEE